MAKHKANICPKCGSSLIYEGEAGRDDDGSRWNEVECPACGFFGVEHTKQVFECFTVDGEPIE